MPESLSQTVPEPAVASPPGRLSDAPAGTTVGLRSADLVGSRRVINQAFPSLSLVDDRTATVFGRELCQVFQGSFEVTAESSGICKSEAFAETLPAPGCLNYLHFDALGGNGLLSIDLDLLFNLLERLFGGAGLPADAKRNPSVRRRFSSIEERVIRRVVRLFGRAMEAAWRALLPITVRHLSIETQAKNIPIASPTEAVVATTFIVSLDDDVCGTLRFAMPLSLLEVHKQRLSVAGYEEVGASDETWRGTLTTLFERVPVTLVAELGTNQMTLGDFLSLAVGDVIRLSQSPSQPSNVSIEGVAKYVGRPTVRDGNLAIRLETLHPRATTEVSERDAA